MRNKTSLPWLWLALAVIILDQLTKIIALHYLPFGQPIAITSFFNLLLVHNPGAAFSLWAKDTMWHDGVFMGTAIIVSSLLIWWLYKLPRGKMWLPMALAFVIGGALGNLVDRIMHGFVIDFLDFHINTLHWPVFNLADSAVVVGVIMLVIDFFWHPRKR